MGIAGRASFYCCTAGYGNGMYAAAGPKLRIAMGGAAAATARQPWKGKTVHVCDSNNCVDVRLVDWCQCHWKKPGEKLIDLNPAAMSVLDSAYRVKGVLRVRVSW